MTKAAELAKMGEVLTNSQLGGRRNLIINGAMQVAQRGDATGKTSGAYYASDRFQTSLVSIGTWSIENVSDSPAAFSNSHKLTCTTPTGTFSAGDFAYCRQKIEAQNLQQLDYGQSSAKTFTISFYVKSNKTGNASLEISQPDSSPTRAVALQYTINTANTWEYKEITVVGDTSGVINNDNGTGLQLFWWLRSGSTYTGGSHQTAWYERSNSDRNASNLDVGSSADDYWQITGVQLEVGSQATPFEHRSYGEELALCQRYYWRSTGDNFHAIGSGLSQSSTEGRTTIPNPVDMRAAPTLGVGGTLSGNVAASTQDVTSIGSSWSGIRANMVGFAITGASSGSAFMIHHKDNTSNYFDADSEL
jgi:hypothetical protein